LIADDGNHHNDVQYEFYHHYDDQIEQEERYVPQSSHGFELLEVGGNVMTSPDILAKLAAAAVSPNQAVI